MVSSLAGAWERVSDTEEGIAVFTDSHYSLILQNKNRKQYDEDNPDDASELEAYRTHQSQGGTYKLSGNSITLGREFCRHPGRSGIILEWDIVLEGDTMTWSRPGDPTSRVRVWRKK